MIFIFFAIFWARTVRAEYYPDLTTQYGNSCSEKTLFALTNDPFYNWVSRSYLALGFGVNDNITSQEAGIAYKKLCAWRVARNANGRMVMFNAPEPHVLGGSFRQGGNDIVANMTVNWGLSIRSCSSLYDKGPNICRYTSQIIASKEGGDVTFKVLLAEVPFMKNGIASDVKYLINWVSNANTSGAVGEKWQIEKRNEDSWYYFNPLLDTTCNNKMSIGYIPDMAAFLHNSYVECSCVGNVCVKIRYSYPIYTGVFKDAGGCKDLDSYWVPLSGGLWLYSYSTKSNVFHYINSIVELDGMNDTTVAKMDAFRICFEGFIDSNKTQSIQDACPNYNFIKYNETYSSSNLQIVYYAHLVSQSVQKAVESGDDCQEGSATDKVCSSDLLTDLEKQEIRGIIAKSGQLQEVRDYAKNQWQSIASKRHTVYLDIITALLAVLTTTTIIFSEALVTTEQKIVNCVQWIFRMFKAKREMVDGIEGERKDRNLSSWMIIAGREAIRLVLLVGVIAECVYNAWKSLKAVELKPQAAWSQTYHYQARKNMVFLVTTTSTIKVKTINTTLICLSAILLPYLLVVMYFSHSHVKQSPLLANTKASKTKVNSLEEPSLP